MWVGTGERNIAAKALRANWSEISERGRGGGGGGNKNREVARAWIR